MVVLAIIVVISTVILSSQGSFNRTLMLANTAYDMALTFRSAQTFGLSSRAAGVAPNVRYGLHFQNATPNTSYILFADTSPAASCGTPDCKPGDYLYTSGPRGDAPPVQTYGLNNSITIGNFCASTGVTWLCENRSGPYSGGLSALDITFSRPDADVSIRATTGGPYASYTAACLAVASPQGDVRTISISSAGQIVANAASVACPP